MAAGREVDALLLTGFATADEHDAEDDRRDALVEADDAKQDHRSGIAGGLIEAEVRWTKGTQFGCQFKEKFDLKLLQPTKPAVKSTSVMRPTYLTGTDTGQSEGK